MSTDGGVQPVTSRSRHRDFKAECGLNQLSGDGYRHRPPALDCSGQAAPSERRGPYGSDLCESPESSTSEHSMNQKLSHSGSPIKAGSPSGERVTATGISRLSLDHGQAQDTSTETPRGRDSTIGPCQLATKRSASSELAREAGRHSPGQCSSSRQTFTPRNNKTLQRRFPQSGRSTLAVQASFSDRAKHVIAGQARFTAVPRDSGYESNNASRKNTVAYPTEGEGQPDLSVAVKTALPAIVPEDDIDGVPMRHNSVTQSTAKGRYSGLILQPDSSPISQEQLATEVKGIYAGLVMVEAKCINIDAAQAADPKSHLGPEQWQALIALHRTLLYEHHDFLMATQHPSATQALRGLATKYSMPARMWKHGIHAFLEVLRHRRPDSQDYMLAFIYLAYQMMALLFETVPSFTDTWIECLGDLARYRMAIEEEKEAHATWGGVAARWYTMASDRHPAIGRLYHHLGILERPSLRKFCFYAKSLTCVIPFPNARDSLSTLCGPIVQDDKTIESSRQSAEARIVTYHALVYTGRDLVTVNAVGQDALELLLGQPIKLRDFGAYLAVANIAALFELGSATNLLWQLYTSAINQAMQSTRPSMNTGFQSGNSMLSNIIPDTAPKPLLDSTTDFLVNTFEFVLQNYCNADLFRECMPFVHVSLVWIHSLVALRTRLNNGGHNTYDIPVSMRRLSFPALSGFLNTLIQHESVTAHILECARQGVFLAPERKEDARPLSEDYVIRGLIWGQFYFCPGWFDSQSEDDGRAIETSSMAKARCERVIWLGLYIAFHTEYLHFDVHRKVFSAPSVVQAHMPANSTYPAVVATAETDMEGVSEAVAVTPRSRSSMTNSSGSNSDEGFHIVKKPKISRRPSQYTYAKVAATATTDVHHRPKKSKQDINAFRVADENGNVDWSADGDSLYREQTIRTGYSRH